MIVVVNTTTDPAAVRLDEPETFTALAVAMVGEDHARFADAAGRLGRVDGEHVWLAAAALTELAG
ncbi:MAG TPA: hypothetical protein VN238_12820, partial [Solirubrobacteraceae bacterium]|nr:hypothetical protein [Solirubrobacteraceae bacterium]